MKKLILFISLIYTGLTYTQDTTWVQTLTFDSIATRRGVFNFPAELNTKRFEKVLMYYKLKCSPLTPWDQYNCGEWDYLAYSRIFEHTGVFDSVEVLGNQFVANFTTPNTIAFDLVPFTRVDTYVREEKNRSGASLTTQNINGMTTNSYFPFDVSKNGGRFQYLISANELINAGITAGDIQSLRLYVNSFLLNGELKYPQISIKSSTLTELINFEQSGFTEVYNASHWSNGSQSELVNGANDFLFYQAFTWNGTDNLIIEFYYENPESTNNIMLFDSENISTSNALGYNAFNGHMKFNGSNKALSELSDFTMGNEMTIAFWAKGTGSAGTNTSLLEAYDTLNNRIVNLHFPWSDNRMYFDAGKSSGYDRIDKAMIVAEIDNNWNHWALVKNATTGTMKIYKNGVLWHSGTGKTIPIGYIHRMIIGSNIDYSYGWKGKIDEFQVYNVALSETDIQAWMKKKIDNTHPYWSNLLVYHDFDNKLWVEDMSDNNHHLMPSEYGMFAFDEYPQVAVEQLAKRPVFGFGQGTVSGAMVTSEHPFRKLKEPMVIYEYTRLNRHFDIVNARVGQVSGDEITYDLSNQIVSQTPFLGTNSMTNQVINYHKLPFELLNDIEIGRYITPYGIGFDLGPNGFNYIFDVTDYQQYLKNAVDLEAHNTQELIDLKFAFIEGIPPRDVHHREPIWSEWRSYQYGDMDNNTVLSAKTIQLADTSEMFKIKTRFTGHGHNGSVNCCEWDSKDHQILVNGTPRFNWEIWQDTECGDNPNIGQGGTWPYAREGWCPGDMVKEFDHELTPYVASGQAVTLDYDIENVPSNDQAQANGNYVVAMDLISYSAPNFQHDAAIVDILNPNNYEYYQKYNPTCAYPRVILQNTGALPLTQCTIRIYVETGRNIDFNWTGNLGFLEKEIVEIPIEDLSWWYSMTGSHTFHAEIIGVENTSGDDYANNNKKTTQFDSPEMVTGPFFVWFITNNRANENSYKLIKDNGEVIFERTSLANSTHYKDTFDLAPGCYSIILEDTDHDGISFWYSAQAEGETAGSFKLRNVGGSIFETIDPDFGRYARYNFSVKLQDLGTKEIELNNHLNVFPNPSDGLFYIDLGGDIQGKAHLEVVDLAGRCVLQKEMNKTSSSADITLDMTANPKGFYTIKVTTGTAVYTKQIIKN